MSDIAKDVLDAQQDRNRLNQLISDYLPFIKKQLSGLNGLRLEYDDMLSLAMLTFSGCVHQYSLEKGNFLFDLCKKMMYSAPYIHRDTYIHLITFALYLPKNILNLVLYYILHLVYICMYL